MIPIFTLVHLTGAVLSFIVIVGLVHSQKESYAKKILLLLIVTTFLYHLCSVFGGLSNSPDALLTLHKINIIATCCTGLLMMLFTVHACQSIYHHLLYRIFLAFDICIIIASSTCEHHILYYKSIAYHSKGLYLRLDTVPGFFYNVNLYIFSCITIYCIITTVSYYLKGRTGLSSGEKRKRFFLVLASLSPVVSFFLQSFQISDDYDPTSILMLLFCIIAFIAIYRFRMFDMVQDAKEYILDTMDVALVITDAGFHYLSSNSHAKKLFPVLSHAPEHVLLKKYSPLLYDALTDKSKCRFLLENRHYECRITAVYTNHMIKGYTICIYDITEQHLYTQKILALKNEADSLNKAKSRFLANVSHEVRTPMNAILGMSEIAVKNTREADTAYALKSIHTAGKSLLEMLNSILDFSKIEFDMMPLSIMQYDLEEFIYDIANIIFLRLESSSIQFFISLSGYLPKGLTGDQLKLKEVILNILGNAVKFTSKGRIDLIVNGVKTDFGVSLSFSIKDTGIGIRTEDLEIIFQSYTQINPEQHLYHKGTGLGLSIAKSYVEMMNGTIRVESEYQTGTTFFVSLEQGVFDSTLISFTQLTKESLVHYFEKNFAENSSSVFYPNTHVLVVDDVAMNLQVAKGFMETYRITVDTALSGIEALEKISSSSYDMIFLDHMMPGMDGIETLQNIRSLPDSYANSVPVIILSANTMLHAPDYFTGQGFDGFIEKPISSKQLQSVFHTHLSQKAVLIDYVRGLENSGGHMEVYLDVLRSFVSESRSAAKQLTTLIKQDMSHFCIVVHGLKGSSKNIGAPILSNIAEKLERDAIFLSSNEDLGQRKTADLSDSLSAFLIQIEEVCSVIDTYITSHMPAQSEKKFRLSLDAYSLQRLQYAFENFDIDMMELELQELERYSYSPKEQDILNRLRTLADHLDYEEGAAFLSGMV